MQAPTTIAEALQRAVAIDPDSEALVTRSSRLSYAQLDTEANRAAHLWRSFGADAGTPVAVSLPNDVDIVVAFHGAMRIGAVWVGINTALAAPEQRWMLQDAGVAVYLTDAPVASSPVRSVSSAQWRAALADQPTEPVEVSIDPYAPAGIAYTSGTTGRPKGAVHTQWNLLLPGAVLCAERGYGPALRKGDCLPLTILNMMVLTTLLVTQAGGTSIIMDRIDAQGVAGWIRDEGVTTWNGPPALLYSLAHDDAVHAGDLATLDEVWNGGADCPDAIRAAFEAKFGREVLGTYGLTEAPAVVSIDPRGGPHLAGSSGMPLGHLEVQILDDTGGKVPAGATGEICVRPADMRYRPMLGYLGRPDETNVALSGDMLHTGDVGFLGESGELHVRDRKKLVILRGGANVYPAEVERVVHELAQVAGCAVVGIPDDRLGERVVAVVQPVSGVEFDPDAVRAHCAANLARYKVPERIVTVDEFPRNAMGKIVRSELAGLF